MYSSPVALHLVTHPVAQDALVSLRDHATRPTHFRRLAHRVGLILAMDATKDVATKTVTVQTPLESTSGRALSGDIVVVAVLRAGLCLVDPVLEVIPHARVGHIGLRRDEVSAEASCYSVNLPKDLSDSLVLLVDPMLATGGSAILALNRLKAEGAQHIRLLCVVAAPEGVAIVERAHPDVDIYTPALDRQLNERKYILPGLGDFGDRLYGTGE